MERKPNTDKVGKKWSEFQKVAVWKKGKVISGIDADICRNDELGKRIKWGHHGNRESSYGWEIDHINPVSNGGADNIDNLQPLHWKNNTEKADKLDWIEVLK
ncbi:HNH endonuclease signature motif containing protein [Flavivirga amylovorans]|uniref:HNH endonuclease n=2 Tax=Flavivirga TaxID=1209327 RepID=A0A4S1DWX7_9FLAO|nr:MULTISPECIES: HNH endonuclease signature motif containing protein [Flavivirga]MDO5988413.1 HNH endonuclease signature motif containing protein [Flavivirga amylovorans]TGV02435.1 HNH endonuclease [Flavivirga rizhaonensis]